MSKELNDSDLSDLEEYLTEIETCVNGIREMIAEKRGKVVREFRCKRCGELTANLQDICNPCLMSR